MEAIYMHYAVGVITKQVPNEYTLAEILSPYDENLEVEPYVAKTKQEIIDDAKKTISEIIAYLRDQSNEDKDPSRYQDIFRWHANKIKLYEDALEKNDPDTFYKLGIDLECFSEDNFDEDKNYLSTYNPDSKWDWWCIGGRFSDVLPKNPMPISEWPEKIKLTDEEIKEKHEHIYNVYQTIQDGTYDGFYRVEYMQQKYPTLQSFCEAHVNPHLYAIVDLDGLWHEPGRMGWFSSMAEPDKEREWNDKFYDTFIVPNRDCYITVIDCHI